MFIYLKYILCKYPFFSYLVALGLEKNESYVEILVYALIEMHTNPHYKYEKHTTVL